MQVSAFMYRIFRHSSNRRRHETNGRDIDFAAARRTSPLVPYAGSRPTSTECSEGHLSAAKDSFMAYHRRAVNLGEAHDDHELLAILSEIRQDLVDHFEHACYRITKESENLGYNPILLSDPKRSGGSHKTGSEST